MERGEDLIIKYRRDVYDWIQRNDRQRHNIVIDMSTPPKTIHPIKVIKVYDAYIEHHYSKHQEMAMVITEVMEKFGIWCVGSIVYFDDIEISFDDGIRSNNALHPEHLGCVSIVAKGELSNTFRYNLDGILRNHPGINGSYKFVEIKGGVALTPSEVIAPYGLTVKYVVDGDVCKYNTMGLLKDMGISEHVKQEISNILNKDKLDRCELVFLYDGEL